jgi:DNA-binding GntR family transcriptional regulator
MKVSDQIRLHLEEAISKGDLLPGDAIDESALAEQFGVSKTPIREALIQLQAQGWVSNMPRGGSTVAKMNLQQLLSLWELLAELEAVAVRLACERMSEEDLQKLFALHEESRPVAAAEDLQGWQKLNLQFHELIYQGTRNPFLRQEVLRIRFRTGVYRRHAFGALGRLQASFEQHELIVQALRLRDADSAVLSMRDHMRPGRDAKTLNDFILNLPTDLLATA